MKKSTSVLVLFIFLFTQLSYSQSPNSHLVEKEANFYDIQDSFNLKWDSKQVKNGKYIKNGKLVKAPGWKQFKRWEWYWQQRVGPSGQFPKGSVIWDEFEIEKNKNANKKTSKTAAGETWKPKGPYDKAVNGLGRVNCLTFHPTLANTFWIGTPAGGIWKTTDGGAKWVSIANDLPVLGVSSIVVDPINPEIMYIATGDGEGAASLQAFGAKLAGDTKSVGIFKSINGGSSWTNILAANQSDGLLIRKLLINPDNGSVIYAASNKGIYKTINSGSSWAVVQAGYFMEMEFKPSDPNTIYASTFDDWGDAQVYVSTDGTNFIQTSNFTGINRIEIAVTPAYNSLVDLLCSSSADGSLYGLYYSASSGANSTWNNYYDGTTAGNNLLGWIDDGSSSGGQGSYDLAYAIDPNNESNILLGGVITFKTSDEGTVWKSSNVWTDGSQYNTTENTQVVHADKHFLIYHPTIVNLVYECNDGGVFKSTDGGDTWTNISNGLQISQLYSISSSQTDSKVISGGRQDNGTVLIDSDGEYEISGGDGMITIIDYTTKSTYYTGYVNGEITRNEIVGVGSSQTLNDVIISANLPGGQLKGVWLTPYLLDPTTSSTIYAGYADVYKSTNKGDSWVKISNFGAEAMNYLAVANTNSNYIYAGWTNSIKMTSDGGTTWSTITGTLPVSSENISSITVDPKNEKELTVTFSGYTAGEKIYYTEDAGITWVKLFSTGLPNLPVNCLAIAKKSEDVYVGTDLGVYYANKTLNKWEKYGTGLPNVVVTDLDIQYSASKLCVGTFGRGIWEIDLKTPTAGELSVNPIKEMEQYFTIYPNPNGGTFQINTNEKPTSIKLINTLGQTIWENNNPKIGTQEISGIGTGMYNLIIDFQGHLVAKKLIVK